MRALAIAFALLAGTGIARADRLEEAKKHFVIGKAAHDAGRYDEAIKEYQAAYDLAPLPELLFNLGQVYRLKGDKQKALDHYGKYLVVAPKGPVAADARKYSAQLEKELAAEPPPPPPVETKPEPAPPPPEPVIQPPPPPPEEPRETATPGRGMVIGAYVAGGLGLVAAGVAIKYGLDASSASDDVSSVDDGRWDQQDIDRVQAGEDAEKLSLICTGVAAVAIGTGAVLYFMGKKKAERANVALVPHDGGGVLSFAGRF